MPQRVQDVDDELHWFRCGRVSDRDSQLMVGSPTEAVEQCRNTLNLLAQIATGKDFEANTMRQLLKSVKDDEKNKRLYNMWKALLIVVNDPHHPRVDRQTWARIEYSTDEARYVLSMTAATVEFAGLLLSRQ